MSKVLKVLGMAMVLTATASSGAGAQDTAEERARARAERAERAAAVMEARVIAATRQGWIGITYTTDESDGAIVITDVVRDSPAERAGLRRGDRIVRWNGDADPADAVGENPPQPGDTVRLRIAREGARDRDVTVVAGSARERAVTVMSGRDGDVVVLRPSRVSETLRIHLDSLGVHADSLHTRLRVILQDSLGPALQRFEAVELPRVRADLEAAAARLSEGFASGARSVAGAEFAEVNSGLAEYFGTDRGALVLRVAPETPAARSGLRAGDVVVSANGHPIDAVRDLREAVTRARDRDVELEIVRRGARSRIQLRWE